jgi:hypothetical protein
MWMLGLSLCLIRHTDMKESEGGDVQLYAFLSWQQMDTSLGFKVRAPCCIVMSACTILHFYPNYFYWCVLPCVYWYSCSLIAQVAGHGNILRPGTQYPHVTWAHVMLRVQLGCERRFDIEFYDVDSDFCHSAYVTWSHVELWSAHVPARLSYFCCRTHFVRREVTYPLLASVNN